MIPEDWQALPASQIGRFRGGTGFPLSFQGLQEGTIPFYKVSDMNNDGNDIFMDAANNWVTEEARRRIGAHAFPAGSIVFAKVGAAVFLERKKILSRSSCIDNNMAAFVLDERQASVPFVHSQLLAKKLGDLVATTALPSLSGKVLGGMILAVPPLAEQSAIATALSHVDALLSAQDALIAKKRAIKQGAMQELLIGKRRLPGFSGKWEVRQLGSVLRFQVGFPFSSVHFNEAGNGIRLVKNRDLKADDQIFHYDGEYEAGFVVMDGDVLIGMDGDFLPCLWAKGEALLNQRVGRIISSKSLDLTYAYYRLQEPLKEIEAITSSTTVKHLSHGDVEGIEVPLPGIDEQVAIAEVLSDMDAEVAVLEAKREKTVQLKQGMMQELLTGRIRLI